MFHYILLHSFYVRTYRDVSVYWLTYLLTYSMVQSPSWAANWFAASQEIPRISRNPKVRYRTHKSPPPVSFLGQTNPLHIRTFNLLEIHPNIIHPSTPRSPQWSLSLRYSDQIRVRTRDRMKSLSCRERRCSLLQILEIGSLFHSSSYAMWSGEIIPADINYILLVEKLFHLHILQRQRTNGDTSTLIRTHGLELIVLK